jgi:hypothetical protein
VKKVIFKFKIAMIAKVKLKKKNYLNQIIISKKFIYLKFFRMS